MRLFLVGSPRPNGQCDLVTCARFCLGLHEPFFGRTFYVGMTVRVCNRSQQRPAGADAEARNPNPCAVHGCSLDEVDPELLRTFDRLGIPLAEQKRLSNVAVDAVFDSVSIATTFKKELREHGIIFCSISEAVRDFPELVRKHLGSVVRLRCWFIHHRQTQTCDCGVRSLHVLQYGHTCCSGACLVCRQCWLFTTVRYL